MRLRESAICLRAFEYSETSQVVWFLTRGAGMARVLAKGTKRPKSKSGGAIDLLSEGDLVFRTGGSAGLGTLMEFSETAVHAGLRRDASRLNKALYMLELAGELLAEEDPHPQVFDLLHNCLARLGQADSPAAAVLAYFQWRLLKQVGLLGDLDKCVSCGAAVSAAAAARGRVYFSSRAGGPLCGDCEPAAPEKYRLDRPTVEGLAVLAAARANKRASLEPPAAEGVNRLLAYHAAQQLGHPLKMARHAMGR